MRRRCGSFARRVSRLRTVNAAEAMVRSRMRPQDPRRLAAIALVSAAVILLQVAVTRILSVVVWYHWAFFAISLAMLGVGAPGVWFSFVQQRERWLRPLLLSSGLLVPAGVIAIVQATHRFPHTAILFCLAALLPAMLALGAAVCVLLLGAKGAAIGRLYAFDLLGACVGAVAVVPLLERIPTPALAGALGLLPLAAYGLLGGARAPGVGAALLLLGALAWGAPFAVRHSKVYDETRTRTKPIYERWTSTARITIFDNIFFFKDPTVAFGWGMGRHAPRAPIPRQYWIEQDGSAGTPITNFDGDLRRYGYLFDDVTTIGYQLRPPQRVAIVGSGGGRDILTARLAGAREIDAIELNGAIVDALRGPFADFSGHVYDLPGVSAIVGEGRSVLTRSSGGYDLIQISLIDSWAATTAGAYSLSESNLYTVEAYRLYWSRLSEGGQVSTSRWAANSTGVGVGGAELPRLILLVQAALRAEGVADPDAHLAVVQGGRVATVLMSRTPFEAGELARLRDIATARGFDLLLPESSTPERSRWLQDLMEQGPGARRDQGLRLDPPTDDKPFFFQVVSPFQTLPERVIKEIGTNGEGVAALRALVVAMTLVALALFFAPFALGRRLPRAAGVLAWQHLLRRDRVGVPLRRGGVGATADPLRRPSEPRHHGGARGAVARCGNRVVARATRRRVARGAARPAAASRRGGSQCGTRTAVRDDARLADRCARRDERSAAGAGRSADGISVSARHDALRRRGETVVLGAERSRRRAREHAFARAVDGDRFLARGRTRCGVVRRCVVAARGSFERGDASTALGTSHHRHAVGELGGDLARHGGQLVGELVDAAEIVGERRARGVRRGTEYGHPGRVEQERHPVIGRAQRAERPGADIRGFEYLHAEAAVAHHRNDDPADAPAGPLSCVPGAAAGARLLRHEDRRGGEIAEIREEVFGDRLESVPCCVAESEAASPRSGAAPGRSGRRRGRACAARSPRAGSRDTRVWIASGALHPSGDQSKAVSWRVWRRSGS